MCGISIAFRKTIAISVHALSKVNGNESLDSYDRDQSSENVVFQ